MSTRRTMGYVPGGEKVPRETKVPFRPLVSQKVPVLLESRNAVEHSATVKASNDGCDGCVPPYIKEALGKYLLFLLQLVNPE